MARIDEIFKLVRQHGASDLHLTTGAPPMVRINGEIVPIPYEQMSPEIIQMLLFELMDPELRDRFDRDKDVDFSYEVPGALRLRCNIYEEAQGVAGAFRLLPSQILNLEQLGVPAHVGGLTDLQRGLVLVTGPPGSGKSSTLAAMIDHINDTRARHVLTIEDPIEYRHVNKKSLISQREVGRHTPSFAQALKGALREDPDVILVGEMRDPETMALAITAAATGQLVLATLHTMSAAQTVDRILDSFEGEKQNQVRLMLAESLKGILAQRLIRRADGSARVLGLEILLASTAVAALIRERKTFQLASVIQTGKREGMQTIDDSILGLVRAGIVSVEDAANHVTSREVLAAVSGPAPAAAQRQAA